MSSKEFHNSLYVQFTKLKQEHGNEKVIKMYCIFNKDIIIDVHKFDCIDPYLIKVYGIDLNLNKFFTGFVHYTTYQVLFFPIVKKPDLTIKEVEFVF